MVVGTGSYKDTSEAFPLDKKTLNKIVLRSFCVGSSLNAETGESIGWTWAMMPGLQKIHTDAEDLSLSMGHNLEFISTGSFFSTFAMGVTLSLEQQKADLDTIRSVRTTVCAACDSLSVTVFRGLLIPFIAALACALCADTGSLVGPLVYFLVLAAIIIALRYGLMYYGYKKGTAAAEKLINKKNQISSAFKTSGIFMLGAMAVLYGRNALSKIYFTNTLDSSSSITLNSAMQKIFPGLIPLAITLLMYYLLTKKNWSIAKCVILVLVIGLAGSLIGFWTGMYTSPFTFSWES